MRFVYPEFLYALSLLAVPVIVHLFNFRRFKKVFFTNVRFLKEIKEETTTRSKLKHLLVLLMRLLAVTFLVLAFAQPFRPSDRSLATGGTKALSIYVDNSFSMESASREGSYLDEAKKRAREIALSGNPSDQYQLLTNDFEARHQRLLGREQFLAWIDEIRISPATRRLSDVIARQMDMLAASDARDKAAYCISDFQETQADLLKVRGDTTVRTYLVPVTVQPAGNVYIDSCWFTSPVVQADVPIELNARLVNASDQDVDNVQLKLLVNGVQKSLAGVSLASGASAVSHLTFTVTQPGIKKGELEITDHPIVFDNTWFFSFVLDENRKLASIDGGTASAALKALFAAEPYFRLTPTPMGRIDYSSLPESQAVFLNELPDIPSGLADELEKYVRGGGTVVVFPDTAFDPGSYNRFLTALDADTFTGLNTNPDKVDRLTTESPLFADVFERRQNPDDNLDLPVALQHFELSAGLRTTREVIMRLQGGSPFMCAYTAGEGTLYVFTVPPDPAFGNFTRHALFVPVVYRIALLSGTNQKLFYRLGDDEPVTAGGRMAGETVFHLVNRDMGVDVIPEVRPQGNQVRVVLHDAVREAGIYDLTLNGEPVSALAFNYDRAESSLHFLSREGIAEAIGRNASAHMQLIEPGAGDLTARLVSLHEGTRYWKICVALALLFLAAEVVLLRFWK